jgi:hypothetical protein
VNKLLKDMKELAMWVLRYRTFQMEDTIRAKALV